jgi:hypothetical protein
MKITMNIDCTPDEARAFLGLPELKPLQDQLIRQMQERIASGIQATPEEMLKTWAPAMQGFEQLQSLFAQMSGVKRD